MKLPFTFEEFLTVFENYNLAVFPMQLILYLLALVVIYMAVRKEVWADRAISGILSFFWIWMGSVYHIVFFAPVNKAAYFFGILFVLQGILFAWKGIFQDNLRFQLAKNSYGIVGATLLLFALIVYPVLGYFLGHQYPAAPTFGLPCPTTIFTLGMFLLLDEKYPKAILIVPFIWATIGFSAALTLGMIEDFSLPTAAFVTLGMIVMKHLKNHGRTTKGRT
jgi:hypothetical protein